MFNRLAPAVAAGLAAAVLFALAAKGLTAAIPLSLLTPLPLFIAVLGWGFEAALIAIAIATVALTALFGAEISLPFFLVFGPATLGLGFVALARVQKDGAGFNFLPLSMIALTIPLASSIAVSVFVLVWAYLAGSYHAMFADMSALLAPAVTEFQDMAARAHVDLPPELSGDTLARLMALSFPGALAIAATVLVAVNFWLAARAAQISGLLARPWPDLPSQFRASRIQLGLTLLAFAALCLFRSVAVLYAGVLFFALIISLSLCGLAVMHDWLRGGGPFRFFLIAVVYLLIVWLFGLPIYLFALIGFADAIYPLRKTKLAQT
ncbi:DUF2232 domain-containing protein [Methylovirgula sp. 4M-Z18]|uniref:DUF2232 domain-containing protein n=1 Tax=Methylovirgula sp. 4M-Z18 TaxID=2293567 RepID=UPI000E2FE7E2|nr:DUF2232 domain-containing protein [Methylovirgula sp. 4M-Z18]RFB80509.1 DUF2232 domain-containing protein [Methylovirgula sp. 4M-Z18]